MTTLVLWDGSARWPTAGRSGTWDVAVVGASAAILRRRHAEDLARAGDVRFLDLAPHAASAREAVAAFLTRAIAELPRDDLGELWWALEVCEKSPFRGRLVERLYRLALLDRLRAAGSYEAVVVAVDDLLLEAVVNGRGAEPPRLDSRAYWASALRELRSALAGRLAGSGWPRPRGGISAFTFYPYWWLRPFAADATERFLDVRPPRFSYAAWLSAPRTLLLRVPARKVATRRNILPLQREVGVRALLSLLSAGRYLLARRAARRSRAVAPFGSFDVTPLVADEVARSLSSTQLFAWLLLRDAIRGHVSRAAPAAILYRVEFQPFEHALLLGARGTMTVGFRHSPFGAAYLPMRFERGALAGRDMPLPDAMLVSGPVGAATLEAQGFPGRIAVCGPQRHPGLREAAAGRQHRSRPRGELVAYVAIAIVHSDTEALLVALAEAALAIPELRLVLKTHPSRELDDRTLRAFLNEQGLASRVAFAGADLYGELSGSDVAVMVGSTIAFESVALGVPAVVFENPATYAATSLAEYANGLHLVRDGRELAAALADVRDDGPVTRAMRQSWPVLLRSVFGDSDAPIDSQLLGALREVGVEGVDL